MRDIAGWLTTATRSLAVDLAGRERRRAAREWLRVRLVLLLAVGCGGVVAAVGMAAASVAVGVVLAFGPGLVVVAVAWALVVSLLAVVPLAALRTGAAVHGRLV